MELNGLHVPNLRIEGKFPNWLVYLDDVEIPTKELQLSLKAGTLPVATIEMVVGDVTVDTDCLLDLLANSVKDKIQVQES